MSNTLSTDVVDTDDESFIELHLTGKQLVDLLLAFEYCKQNPDTLDVAFDDLQELYRRTLGGVMDTEFHHGGSLLIDDIKSGHLYLEVINAYDYSEHPELLADVEDAINSTMAEHHHLLTSSPPSDD